MNDAARRLESEHVLHVTHIVQGDEKNAECTTLKTENLFILAERNPLPSEVKTRHNLALIGSFKSSFWHVFPVYKREALIPILLIKSQK